MDYYDRKVARADEVAGLWFVATTILVLAAFVSLIVVGVQHLLR